MNTNTNAHRETWLNRLAALMAPRFEELGHPIPAVRIAIGFTGSRKGENGVAGVCWHKSNSADGHFEIFISPDQADPMEVAAILAHELAHAAVGFEHGHKGEFAKTVAAVGMVRPFTSSVAGDAFKAWVQPHLDVLGELPHAPLRFRTAGKNGGGGAGKEGEGEGEGGKAGGSSNDKPKQGTRMLKACCSHQVDGKACGYTVRLSRKWALELGAACPAHGAMEVEGADEQPEGEDE